MDEQDPIEVYGNADLSEGTDDRPLVTFALFAYNQEKYIREAVEGAFSQTYSPLEIILSDDCSSDRTFQIMKEMAREYNGPHRVSLVKRSNNLGLAVHVNEVFAEAAGKYIVVAAGDDISIPERTSMSVEALQARTVLLAHSAVDYIDQDGQAVKSGIHKDPPLFWGDFDLLDAARSKALYIGATGAICRSLYKTYGPMEYRHAWEDLVLGFRAALSGSTQLIDRPLVKYRLAGGLSQTKPDSNYRDMRLKKIMQLRAQVDVFRQRKLDLHKANLQNHQIDAILNDRISSARIRLALKTSMLDVLRCIVCHPLAFLRLTYRKVVRSKLTV